MAAGRLGCSRARERAAEMVCSASASPACAQSARQKLPGPRERAAEIAARRAGRARGDGPRQAPQTRGHGAYRADKPHNRPAMALAAPPAGPVEASSPPNRPNKPKRLRQAPPSPRNPPNRRSPHRQAAALPAGRNAPPAGPVGPENQAAGQPGAKTKNAGRAEETAGMRG